jgi:hypothetical protein
MPCRRCLPVGRDRQRAINSHDHVSRVRPLPSPGRWATGRLCRRDHSWRCNPGSSARGQHPRTLARTGARRRPCSHVPPRTWRTRYGLSSTGGPRPFGPPLSKSDQRKRVSVQLLVEATSSCEPVGGAAPVLGVAMSLISLGSACGTAGGSWSDEAGASAHYCRFDDAVAMPPRQWLERSQVGVRPKVDGRLWERLPDPCLLHRSRPSDELSISLASPLRNERSCGAERLVSHRA